MDAASGTYAAGGLMRYTGTPINPLSLYNASNWTFTSPGACYVEVFASAQIMNNSPGAVNVSVYKNGTVVNLLFNIGTGYGYSIGSGKIVVNCAAGDLLTLKSASSCTVFPANGSCMFKIL
jgi:hypothetical protein